MNEMYRVWYFKSGRIEFENAPLMRASNIIQDYDVIYLTDNKGEVIIDNRKRGN